MIKAIVIFSVLSAGLSEKAHTAFEFKNRGGRSAALGGAYTAVSDDVEAVWWNPAGLRLLKDIQADTSYTAMYGMRELAVKNLAVALPGMRIGTWGFGYSSFGFSGYREHDIRLVFSAGLADGVYLGTGIRKNRVEIGGGGGAGGIVSVDAGIIADVSEYFRLGFCAYSMNRPVLLSGPIEHPEQRFMLGLSALAAEEVRLSLDLHGITDREWQHRLGIELPLADSLFLRAGVQTRPARLSFGIGAEKGLFMLNYAYIGHQTLFSQHMVSMRLRFGRANESSGIF